MNYDADSWDTIARELVDNHTGVHQFNRARLLDDAFNLACAGEIDVSIPLNMTKYLKHETEPFPRDTGIFYLKKIRLFSNSSKLGEFIQKYIDDISQGNHLIVRSENDHPSDSPLLSKKGSRMSPAAKTQAGHEPKTPKEPGFESCPSLSLPSIENWISDNLMTKP